MAAGRATRRRTCHHGVEGVCLFPLRGNRLAPASQGGFPPQQHPPGCPRGQPVPPKEGTNGSPPSSHRPGMLAAGRATSRRVCHQGVQGGSSPCMPLPSGGSRGVAPLHATAIRGFKGDRPPACHSHHGVEGVCLFPLRGNRLAPASQGGFPPQQHPPWLPKRAACPPKEGTNGSSPSSHRPGMPAAGRATSRRVCHQGVQGGSPPCMPLPSRGSGGLFVPSQGDRRVDPIMSLPCGGTGGPGRAET
jgi:hypothetical protein